MSNGEPFDYYHIWLGIPPEDQPPDYYRLLGVRRFESNSVVILYAADRQLQHVKSFQGGPHFYYSQKLLNELSAARLCLLNEASKRAYDLEIDRPGPQHNGVPAPPTEPPPAIEPTDHFTPEFRKRKKTVKKRQSNDWFWPLALAAVAFVVVVMVLINRSPSTVATNTPAPAEPSDSEEIPTDTTDEPKDLELVDLVPLIEPSLVHIHSDLGIGSGVVVDDRGIVLTNYHVLAGAKNATVKLASGNKFEIDGAIAIEISRDMALVVTKGLPGKPIAIAHKLPRKGERVAAFGSPQGLSFSTSSGNVAAIWRGMGIAQLVGPSYVQLGYDPDALWIQHTAAISNGSSGGPLVNMRGELVGLNTFSFKRGELLNFAISSITAPRLLKQTGNLVRLYDLPKLELKIEPEEKPNDLPVVPPRVFPAAVWVDLLAQFDARKPGAIGKWEMRDDQLVLVGTAGTASMELANFIDGAFDLAVDFTLDEAPKHRLTLFLPTGSGQCVLEIETGPKPQVSLAAGDGRASKAIAVALPEKFSRSGTHQVVVSIRKPSDNHTSVEATIDAKNKLTWEGATSKINVLEEESGNSSAVSLAVGGSTATVQEARLREMAPSAPHTHVGPEGTWTPQ